MPINFWGQMVASVCMLMGPLMIAFPTMLIGSNFKKARKIYMNPKNGGLNHLYRHADLFFDVVSQPNPTIMPTNGNTPWTLKDKIYSLVEVDTPKPNKAYARGAIVLSHVLFWTTVFSICAFCIVTLPQVHAAQMRGGYVPCMLLAAVEYIALGLFTIELLLRFFTCPSKWKFWRDGMNWVDVLTVVFPLLEIILQVCVCVGAFCRLELG